MEIIKLKQSERFYNVGRLVNKQPSNYAAIITHSHILEARTLIRLILVFDNEFWSGGPDL